MRRRTLVKKLISGVGKRAGWFVVSALSSAGRWPGRGRIFSYVFSECERNSQRFCTAGHVMSCVGYVVLRDPLVVVLPSIFFLVFFFDGHDTRQRDTETAVMGDR